MSFVRREFKQPDFGIRTFYTETITSDAAEYTIYYILYYTILYYTILYYTILYYTILYYFVFSVAVIVPN